MRGTLEARAVLTALLVSGLGTLACGRGPVDARKNITPEYDPKTGKLQLLKYDSDGDGKIDTVSYMDGARVVKIEIDQNEDGIVDRWDLEK